MSKNPNTSFAHGSPQASAHPGQTQAGSASIDDLVRVFNTALVSTRADSVRDFSSELFSLVESPAFRAILSAVRQHARNSGLNDREAAEAVIQTFRKIDKLWSDYVFQEGVDRIKSQIPTS